MKYPSLSISILIGMSLTFHQSFSADLEEIILREASTRNPDSVSLDFKFPPPVEVLSIKYNINVQNGEVINAFVQFGQLKTVDLQSSLIRCLPYPLIQMTTFQYVDPDASNRNWVQNWWTEVSVPFGHNMTPLDDIEPRTHITLSIYPQVIFEFYGTKISRVSLKRSRAKFVQ